MSQNTSKASLNQRAFKAGVFYILSQLFVRGSTFLTTMIFTRLLSQEQFNQYKLFESWLLIFGPVMSLCLYRSVERAKYDVQERFPAFVSSVQTLSYLSISGFFLLFLIFKDPLLRLCSMTDFMMYIAFLYTYAHTSIMFYQRREKQLMRYRASTAFTAATVIPATLLAVILVLIGKHTGHSDQLLSLRITGYYIPMILGGFLIAVLILVQGRSAIQPSYWKYALRFCLPLIPEALSIQIMNQADKLMVTNMTGNINGSITSLATTVSYIIWILEDSVWNAWLPWMYEKIARKEGKEIQDYWRLLMHAFGLISLLLVLFAPEIILILGGSKYQEAIYLIAPMITGTLFRFYSYSYTAIQNYHKKTGFVAISTVFVMLLNVALNGIFIHLCGYQAAAYTTAFCYLVLMILQAFMEKKITGEQIIPLPKTILISCFWFVLCMLAMLLFQTNIVFRCLAALLIAAAASRLALPKLLQTLKMLKATNNPK